MARAKKKMAAPKRSAPRRGDDGTAETFRAAIRELQEGGMSCGEAASLLAGELPRSYAAWQQWWQECGARAMR